MTNYIVFDGKVWSVQRIDPFAGNQVLIANQHSMDEAIRAAQKAGIAVQIKLGP